MAIALLFVGHWYSSIFFQSFFLHRYGAHRMFYMSRFWERFFYFFTFVSIGLSFFNSKANAVMYRMHHVQGGRVAQLRKSSQAIPVAFARRFFKLCSCFGLQKASSQMTGRTIVKFQLGS